VQPLFDRRLLARRRARAVARAEAGADFLLDYAAADVGERLGAVARRFPRALTLGGATDAAAQVLWASGKVDAVVRADLFAAGPPGTHAADLVLDDEALPFAPEAFDLVVSLLSLQFANDMPGALIQIRRILKPDGLFLGVLPGAGSLAELRAAFASAESEAAGGVSPRVAPFADIRDLGALMQRAGFALPVVDLDMVTLRHADPIALMRDLRAMGTANALAERSRRPGTRRLFARLSDVYAEEHADPDGRVRTTLALVSLSGWAPHPGQPKPLAPGSARISLTRVLPPRP